MSPTPPPLRTLAIDFGLKRIGLALSDAGGRFATPLEVIEVARPDDAYPHIHAWIEKEDVRRLVVGLPLNMNGSRGPAAAAVVKWSKALEHHANVELIFVDERLSTYEASQQLIERKRGGEHLTRKDQKRRLDALAAASFLQAYLDGQLPPLEP